MPSPSTVRLAPKPITDHLGRWGRPQGISRNGAIGAGSMIRRYGPGPAEGTSEPHLLCFLGPGLTDGRSARWLSAWLEALSAWVRVTNGDRSAASLSRWLGYSFGYNLGTKPLESGKQKPVAARHLSRSQGLRAFPLFSILVFPEIGLNRLFGTGISVVPCGVGG